MHKNGIIWRCCIEQNSGARFLTGVTNTMFQEEGILRRCLRKQCLANSATAVGCETSCLIRLSPQQQIAHEIAHTVSLGFLQLEKFHSYAVPPDISHDGRLHCHGRYTRLKSAATCEELPWFQFYPRLHRAAGYRNVGDRLCQQQRISWAIVSIRITTICYPFRANIARLISHNFFLTHIDKSLKWAKLDVYFSFSTPSCQVIQCYHLQ
jgi:hypothetical protein